MKKSLLQISLFSVLLFFLSVMGFAQGKIMIVGGGTENYND